MQSLLRFPPWETLPLRQQVAQMVVVRASGYLFDHQIRYPAWEPPAAVLRSLIQDLGVGGVILLGGSAGELHLRTQQLQDWAHLPLLIAADVEEGVGQRFAGATWFPPPMALNAIFQQDQAKALGHAEAMGATIAQESLAIGLNWVLAPVVDVNNNAANPVINVRAFGETPEVVSHLTAAFLRGAQRHPVLTTAKHFPGHGDTAVDSHLELPIVPHLEDRLQQIELSPFRTAIGAGVDAVMSAHLQIPAWDRTYPATLSPRILTQELRQNLQFAGLIVTDALVMGAIANRYGTEEAAVLAVEAGADILLMPADPAAAIEAVCAAVTSGRIPLERIQASLERIWWAKQKVCAPAIVSEDTHPHAWETLPDAPRQDFTALLSQPQSLKLVQTILQESMTCHGQAPSLPPAASRNLIVVDNLLDSEFLGLQTPAITLPQSLGYSLALIDRQTATGGSDPSAINQPTLLQVFVRGNPFRGSAGLTQTVQTCFQSLIERGQLQALVVYGSPYILEQLLITLPPDIPYVFSYGQMAIAQAVALQHLFPTEKATSLNQDCP
ncbi:beta-glucosidase [Leptolyngbya sp. 'hensonii']|nr:beta-glucosidase [Leptolyngbya sp. 'hensonii']